MSMGPFNAPEIVLDGFKERPEALTVQGMSVPSALAAQGVDSVTSYDKLFVGTSTGNLHVYAYGEAGGADSVAT